MHNPVSPARRSPRGQKAERPGPCKYRTPTDRPRGSASGEQPRPAGPRPATGQRTRSRIHLGPVPPARATAFPQEGAQAFPGDHPASPHSWWGVACTPRPPFAGDLFLRSSLNAKCVIALRNLVLQAGFPQSSEGCCLSSP